MIVFINEKQLTLFGGAKLIDALRMYSNNTEIDVKNGKAYVLDRFGNHVNMDGALSEGARYFVRQNDNK